MIHIRRFLWTLAVHAHDRFPRLVPPLVVQWVEDRFYAACLSTLDRAATEYRESTADEIEALRRASVWSCLAGDVHDHDAGECDERDMWGDMWPREPGDA